MTAIQVGDQLPTLEIPMSATRIVAGAIASRDFMPVHHDRDYAQSQGAPDIFMNILSTTGHCSRYLTDWAGPESFVKRLALRLGAPVFPGSTLTFDGSVTGVSTVGDELHVEVEFTATNQLGAHATATALVTLPA